MNNLNTIKQLIGTTRSKILKDHRVYQLVVNEIYAQNVPKSIRLSGGDKRILNQERIQTILKRVISKSPKEWLDYSKLKEKPIEFWTELIKKL